MNHNNNNKPSGFGWFSHRTTTTPATTATTATTAAAVAAAAEPQVLMDQALARLAQAIRLVTPQTCLPLYTIQYEDARPKPGRILPFIARLDYGPLPPCFLASVEGGGSAVDGMAFNLDRAKTYIPFLADYASPPLEVGAVAYCWARVLPPMIYANRKRNRLALAPATTTTTTTNNNNGGARLVAILDFTHRADDVHYDISKAMGRVLCALGVNHPFTKIECWGCERTFEARLVKCSLCRVARYCSKACQRAHWFAGHRHDCVHMRVMAGGQHRLGEEEEED